MGNRNDILGNEYHQTTTTVSLLGDLPILMILKELVWGKNGVVHVVHKVRVSTGMIFVSEDLI